MTAMKPTMIKTLSWVIFVLMIPIQAYPDEGDSIRTITPLFPPVVIEDSMPDISKFQDSDFLSFENTDTDDASKSAVSDTLSVRSGNTKVGTPTTDGSVSPMGAAVWSMAFDTPKGVGGMTPTVGLAYSSQSGIGNAGWGVGISGFSYITRGTKTLYHDSTVRGVKYDTDDALFLDNRRLLLSSGTAGVSGAIYVPEGDPFTTVKITSYSSTSGPLSFEVTSPNGMVSFYGSTSNARLAITVGGGTRCHSWYVSRREDPNGNYALYSYMQDDLTVYPEGISYGKNWHTGTGADNRISFTYSDASANAARKFVIGGIQGSVRKRLESVRTMTGSDVFREYLLSYYTVSDGSTMKFDRLSSVTCRNGAGEVMHPVSLEWSLLPGHSRTAEILGISTNDPDPMVEKQDSVFLAADLNGDGLADIIRISFCQEHVFDYPDDYYEGHTYVYVHRSERNADGSVTYQPALRHELSAQIELDGWKELVGGNYVADIDGDGLNDLVIPYYTDLPYSTPQLYIRYIMGKYVRNASLESRLRGISLMAADGMPLFVCGDLDGNGLDDFTCLETMKSGGYYHLGICFSLPSDMYNSLHIPLTLPQKPKRLFTGDFNGDGLPDLIALYDGGHKIFYNNGGSNASSLFSNANSTTGSSFGNMWRVEQGDFNGDGLADFVYVGGNSADYYFAMNNGNGTFSISHAITYDIHDQSTDRDDRRFTLTPIDIDRDGLTDLVISKADFEHEGGFSHTTYFTVQSLAGLCPTAQHYPRYGSSRLMTL